MTEKGHKWKWHSELKKKKILGPCCQASKPGTCCLSLQVSIIFLTWMFSLSSLFCFVLGIHTRAAMKNKKSLESWRLLSCGWVQTVFHTQIEDNTNMLFKCDVTPSYKVNDKPHQPWAVLSNCGAVIAAHCTCKAGSVLWLHESKNFAGLVIQTNFLVAPLYDFVF